MWGIIMEKLVVSIENLIVTVKDDYKMWGMNTTPWFRGEPITSTPLIPKLYRNTELENEKIKKRELQLLNGFRLQAPVYADIQIPQRGHTDQWLFLAQHFGIPTRLLDWTEGLLIALYFALNCEETTRIGAYIWMLEPNRLNKLTQKDVGPIEEGITWFSPELDSTVWMRKIKEATERHKDFISNSLKSSEIAVDAMNEIINIPLNISNRNIRAAWEKEFKGTEHPVAIIPTYIDQRLNAQRSRFTIWGMNQKGLDKIENIFEQNILACYKINHRYVDEMKKDLQLLGITHLIG
jgi:hypothetical protein